MPAVQGGKLIGFSSSCTAAPSPRKYSFTVVKQGCTTVAVPHTRAASKLAAMAEQEPLMKPEKGAAQNPGVGPARAWDGHLLACCGSCDFTGWSIFSMAYVCPCLAFG